MSDNNNESKLVNTGWMYKKGKIVSNWKRRYFELYDNGKMLYFSDETERTKKSKKGVANLSIITGFIIIDNKNFQVITPSRTWCFECKFKSEVEEWIDSMKKIKNIYIHNDHQKTKSTDYLNLSQNASILKLITKLGSKNGETILYSNRLNLHSKNSKSKDQSIILLLTNEAVYNIKPSKNDDYTKCQRRIEYGKVAKIEVHDKQEIEIGGICYKTDGENVGNILAVLRRYQVEIVFLRQDDEKEFDFDVDFDGEDGEESESGSGDGYKMNLDDFSGDMMIETVTESDDGNQSEGEDEEEEEEEEMEEEDEGDDERLPVTPFGLSND